MDFLNANVAAEVSFGPATSGAITLPTNVPAGATLVLGVRQFTDLTTDITSVTDTVTGTWGAGSGSSGPTDDPGGTQRSWAYALTGHAGGSGVQITVNFSASISGRLIAGWLDPATIEEFDPTPAIQSSSVTTHTSDTLTADASNGGLVGMLAFNGLSTITADGAGEVNVSNANNSLHFVFESFSSGGSKELNVTSGTARRSQFHQVILAAAAAATASVPPMGSRFQRSRKAQKRRRAA